MGGCAHRGPAHQYLATVGDTFWVQRVTILVAASGTVVTISDTAPTADRYNLTICEVLGGSETAFGSTYGIAR